MSAWLAKLFSHFGAMTISTTIKTAVYFFIEWTIIAKNICSVKFKYGCPFTIYRDCLIISRKRVKVIKYKITIIFAYILVICNKNHEL